MWFAFDVNTIIYYCMDYKYVYVSCMIPMYFMEMYVFVIICILYDPYVLYWKDTCCKSWQ